MKVRDIIKILIGHGFHYDRQRGSHRQYEGYVDGKKRLVPVPGHDGDDLRRGTLVFRSKRMIPIGWI